MLLAHACLAIRTTKGWPEVVPVTTDSDAVAQLASTFWVDGGASRASSSSPPEQLRRTLYWDIDLICGLKGGKLKANGLWADLGVKPRAMLSQTTRPNFVELLDILLAIQSVHGEAGVLSHQVVLDQSCLLSAGGGVMSGRPSRWERLCSTDVGRMVVGIVPLVTATTQCLVQMVCLPVEKRPCFTFKVLNRATCSRRLSPVLAVCRTFWVFGRRPLAGLLWVITGFFDRESAFVATAPACTNRPRSSNRDGTTRHVEGQ